MPEAEVSELSRSRLKAILSLTALLPLDELKQNVSRKDAKRARKSAQRFDTLRGLIFAPFAPLREPAFQT